MCFAEEVARECTTVLDRVDDDSKAQDMPKYSKKLAALFFVPQSGCGIGCLALLALSGLRYSGSAPLSRLVDPRSGYHDIQQLTTFCSADNTIGHFIVTMVIWGIITATGRLEPPTLKIMPPEHWHG